MICNVFLFRSRSAVGRYQKSPLQINPTNMQVTLSTERFFQIGHKPNIFYSFKITDSQIRKQVNTRFFSNQPDLVAVISCLLISK